MGPVGDDERWDVFGPFHDYLARAFPLTYVDNPQSADCPLNLYICVPFSLGTSL